MENKSKNNSNQIHQGHRQRLRDKVLNSGARSFAPHELLEMVLTYSIPRVNTNPIAHNLLRTFGSIPNILNASIDDLTNIEGVGRETAIYLKVLLNLVERYNENNSNKKKEFLFSTGDAVEYFRKHFNLKNYEEMFILGLSKNNEVVSTNIIEGINHNTINFTMKDFAKRILTSGVHSVVLFHTHPNGNTTPTMEDILATEELFVTCSSVNVELFDHIVINETEHFSFRSAHFIEKLGLKHSHKPTLQKAEIEQLLFEYYKNKNNED